MSFYIDEYYRVRIVQEEGIDVKVSLVDYGSTEVVRCHTIMAPLTTLTRFCQPPYGIPCFLEGASSIPLERLKLIFEAQWISFNIGEVKNGRYPVNFAGTSVNGRVFQKLKKIQGEQRLLELPSSSTPPAEARATIDDIERQNQVVKTKTPGIIRGNLLITLILVLFRQKVKNIMKVTNCGKN